MQKPLLGAAMSNTLEGLITRDDIADLAANEQLLFGDEERISILEAMRSIDVQACPGSGKTTLIAAKLILLAKKWPFKNQGICVLSHTNVAKDEIIDRLNKSNFIKAKNLLSYPHFIGTIQEFVNRYLALPYIRSNGVQNIIVDNDEYSKVASQLLNLGLFGWFRSTLNGLGNHEAQEAFLRSTYRFISGDEEGVYISRQPRAWQQDANFQRAKRDLNRLKQYLDEKGFYLYRDMYTHAQLALSRNENLKRIIAKRFPCVFLDEMQDTQKFQDEILCKVFPLNDPRLIVQRFGDPDQAIFHGVGNEERNESFNNKSRDDMDFVVHNSHRFDDVLAEKIKPFSLNEIPLASELSAASLEVRVGYHSTGERFNHTIIIFNDVTVGDVVENFAGIVSSEFKDHYKKSSNFTVKVVGAVGNEIDPSQNQLKIGHYWAEYKKGNSKTSYKETSLVDAVRHCRRSSLKDWNENYKYLINCILKILRIAGRFDNDSRHFSVSTLRDLLETNGTWKTFRESIHLILDVNCKLDETFWGSICEALTLLLGLENFTEELKEYMAFAEEVETDDGEGQDETQEGFYFVSLQDNKIKHSDGFQIDLSTIHGVKGETHDATLIVETKNHTFDLEAMLLYLTGELPSDEHPNFKLPDEPHWKRAFKPNKIFMRQLYVAMSRPKHLLCFAMHADRVSDDNIKALQEKGWNIKMLASPKE